MANLLRHWLTVSLSVLVGIPVLIVTCFLVVFLVPHLDAQHESEFRAHAYEVADRASILITASAERLERMANDVESLPKDDPSIAPRLDALAATGLVCAAERFWAEWRSKKGPAGWLRRVPKNPGCAAGGFACLGQRA